MDKHNKHHKNKTKPGAKPAAPTAIAAAPELVVDKSKAKAAMVGKAKSGNEPNSDH